MNKIHIQNSREREMEQEQDKQGFESSDPQQMSFEQQPQINNN